MSSETTGEGINYISISSGSFCILSGLISYNRDMVTSTIYPGIPIDLLNRIANSSVDSDIVDLISDTSFNVYRCR